jgi:enamine deaminase RidA (YjgF/YER057c/UK114 family)
VPEGPAPAAEQARGLFAAIAEELSRRGARILHERIFAREDAFDAILPVRAAAYGPLDDGVPPVRLAVPEGPDGPVAGVQVHAVRIDETPRLVTLRGRPCGRMLDAGGLGLVALSSLMGDPADAAPDQAAAMFRDTAAVLRGLGGDMKRVARTWLWLGGILDWYGDLNRVRNAFFTECGLLNGDPTHVQLPASTGIGVSPAGGPRCALDAVAALGPAATLEFFNAAGRQRSAFNYGSAFSRGSRVSTPAGFAAYVSGTAAIDEAGATIHTGDAKAQVDVTIRNVRAVLADMGCGDADVVQAFAYSKTPEVEAVFRREYADLPWPVISVQGDVCRDDLLFEVEATACPGAKKG